MQILVLVGLVISLTLLEGPMLVGSAYLTASALVVYLLGVAALSYANTALFLRSVHGGETPLNGAIKRHQLVAMLTRVWLLAGQVGVILFGYGYWITEQLALKGFPLVGEALALAPFVAGLLLMWTLNYPFDRTVREFLTARVPASGTLDAPKPTAEHTQGVWTRREYLAYCTRHYLLFILIPMGLILLMRGGLLWIAQLFPVGPVQYVVPVGSILMLAGIFLLAPALIVRIWKARPLPAGELREALETTCKRLGLRYREIMIWPSSGMIANAAVVGFIGPLRYILLSDALLERTDRRDIEAVFAHEAGHIIHHHVFYAVMFALASISLCVSAAVLVAAALDYPDWTVNVLSLGLLAVFWGLGFGYVSRRFERQCDVTAAWASGSREGGDDPDLVTHEGAAVFAHALQRIADINGIPVRGRNWRHGSIAQRIAYVLWLGGTSGTRTRDDRLVRRIKWALWGLLVLAGGICALEFLIFS